MSRFSKPQHIHWAWHLLLLAAGIFVLVAIIFDQDFGKQWFNAYSHIGNKKQYYLNFLRFVLLAVAGGFIILWFLRKIITNDWREVVLRWSKIPSQVRSSAIIPVIKSSRIKKFFCVFLPIWIVGVSISLIPGYETWANRLTIEKGVFETLTVILYLFSGLTAIKLLLPHFKHTARRGFRRWWLLALAIGCLFIAGEETNWGEQYFHYQAGELIRQVNYQDDVSLHNIPLPIIGGYWANDLSHLLAVFGGILLPFLIWVSKLFRRLILALEIPMPPWISQAYFLVAAIIPQDRVITLQRANIPSELREITIAIGIAIWLWCLMKNSRKSIPFENESSVLLNLSKKL